MIPYLLSLILAINVGAVNRIEYDTDKYISVYTPYGYEEGTEEYKVALLYPGINYDDQFWFEWHDCVDYELNAKNKIDEMINEDECEPLILVSVSREDNSVEDVSKIVQFLGQNYRVGKDRTDWALIGYSGGAEDVSKLMASCNDLFAYYAVFGGGAYIYADDLDIQYLYMNFGSDDVGMWSVLKMRDSLQAKNLIDNSNSELEIIPNTGHSWKNAIRGIEAFLPIFTEKR